MSPKSSGEKSRGHGGEGRSDAGRGDARRERGKSDGKKSGSPAGAKSARGKGKREQGSKAAASGGRPTKPTTAGKDRPGGGRRGAGKANGKPSRPERISTRYKEISRQGRSLGFHVTSTTGGKHNKGSLHAKGRAVDFSVRGKTKKQVEAFMKTMRSRGFKVRDERTRPKGQKVWNGAHIHVWDPRR